MNDVHTLLRWWKRPPPLATDDAFAALYAHTHVRVFRYIYGLHGGTATEAEDLVAETFLRAWQARHRFQGDDAAALGWLLQIARRLVIDAQRRQHHRDHAPAYVLDDLITNEEPPDEHTIRRDQLRLLQAQLARLPDDQREVVVLRYLVGWRVNDIAAHLEVKENNVSVTIRRALARLRRDWPDAEQEDEQRF